MIKIFRSLQSDLDTPCKLPDCRTYRVNSNPQSGRSPCLSGFRVLFLCLFPELLFLVMAKLLWKDRLYDVLAEFMHGRLIPSWHNIQNRKAIGYSNEELEWHPLAMTLSTPVDPSSRSPLPPPPHHGRSQPGSHLSVSRRGRGHRHRDRFTGPPSLSLVPALQTPVDPPPACHQVPLHLGR